MSQNHGVQAEQSQQRLPELQAQARVREQPFVSNKPVIGRLIVLIRELWNSVATKWYVRPLLQQQNRFNQTVTRTILELYQELDQRLIGNDQDLTLVARKVAEGEYRLNQGQKQAALERAELFERLSRLEKLLLPEEHTDQG